MRSGGTLLGRVALGLVVGTAAVEISAPDASGAVVICQRKSRLRLREGACKPKEQAVRLDGASVDPAGLGQVPSAVTADSATSAAAADSAVTADTAASATTADTALAAADAQLLDGLDSTAFQGRIRWAHVASGGSAILSQSGGISVVADTAVGVVVLDFGEDLRGRGIVATVRNGLANRGWAQVSICGAGNGGGAETAPCNVGGDVADLPNELAIALVDHDGSAVDRNFYVAVLP